MFLMSSSLIKVEKELPLVFPNKGWGPLVQGKHIQIIAQLFLKKRDQSYAYALKDLG